MNILKLSNYMSSRETRNKNESCSICNKYSAQHEHAVQKFIDDPAYFCFFVLSFLSHSRIAQWGFSSVAHLLWHWSFVYNDDLRGPVTLTPYAKRKAVGLSLPVLMTEIGRGWDSNTQFSACGANARTHCATAAAATLE